jgi:hypothetical protein
MLIVASVFTTRMDLLHARWQLEQTTSPDKLPLHWRKEHYCLPPEGQLAPSLLGATDYAGTLVVYDWDNRRLVLSPRLSPMVVTPAGYCFQDGLLYLNDSESSHIYVIDPMADFTIIDRISHPYFNDLHSIQRTRRGFLVTSSGIDAIVETTHTGSLVYEWWANEYGFTMTPSGRRRHSGRGKEHRDQYYHTRYHATHVNCAVTRDERERFVLALLFQQGFLIEIDRDLPSSVQYPKVLLDGLVRPHSLRRICTGWTICSSLGKEIVLLDHDLGVVGSIPYEGGWIQDCLYTSQGTFLINDVDGHCLVELSGPPWRHISRTCYPAQWRMGELSELAPDLEYAFRERYQL